MQISSEFQRSWARSISEASDLNAVLHFALSCICQHTEWDYGEAWIPTADNTLLELNPTCYINSDRTIAEVSALEQFRMCSRGLFFLPGVGLPGRVWSSQRSEWLSNASTASERVLLRHQIARAFGVKTGFGVPVLGNDRVLAVLVFFMLDARDEDKHQTELVTTLATYLGRRLADWSEAN